MRAEAGARSFGYYSMIPRDCRIEGLCCKLLSLPGFSCQDALVTASRAAVHRRLGARAWSGSVVKQGLTAFIAMRCSVLPAAGMATDAFEEFVVGHGELW